MVEEDPIPKAGVDDRTGPILNPPKAGVEVRRLFPGFTKPNELDDIDCCDEFACPNCENNGIDVDIGTGCPNVKPFKLLELVVELFFDS